MGCALALLDGNWNNRSNAGTFNWNLNNTSSNANINIGTQTLIRDYFVIFAFHIPHTLVKIKPQRAGFSRFSEIP